MNKTSFRKPPKTHEEKEQFENKFINEADPVQVPSSAEDTLIKSLLLRLPEPLWKDLKKLAFIKESTMTALCIDAIRKKITKEFNKP